MPSNEALEYWEGQKVCIGGREYQVDSVGRKYGHLYGHGTHMRFDLATGRTITSHGSPDTVWPSKAAYEADANKRKAWVKLRQAVASQFTPSKNFDPKNLPQIYRLLDLPEEK